MQMFSLLGAYVLKFIQIRSFLKIFEFQIRQLDLKFIPTKLQEFTYIKCLINTFVLTAANMSWSNRSHIDVIFFLIMWLKILKEARNLVSSTCDLNMERKIYDSRKGRGFKQQANSYIYLMDDKLSNTSQPKYCAWGTISKQEHKITWIGHANSQTSLSIAVKQSKEQSLERI